MNLKISLLIYILVLILIYYISISIGIRVWSSLILSLVVSFLILSSLNPITSLLDIVTSDPLIIIYNLITLVTLFLIIFYIVERASIDINCIIVENHCQ